VIDDWHKDRRRTPANLRTHNVISSVSVIIGPGDHPYGVLGAHAQTRRTFTPDDVNFLQGIASILAATIVRRRGEELREHLLARAISAQEEERTRIARELHDETGQALSAILVGLRSLQDAGSTAPARDALVERLRALASQTVRDIGHLARRLRPPTLDHLGLLPALQRYGEELGTMHHMAVRITGDVRQRFPHNVETTLYRIVQEALTNVARHARARSADVAIQRENGTVRVTVRDDGTGFDVGSTLGTASGRRTLGLLGMHERASLLGGCLAISSRPGEGTSVTVELPVGSE
jgi:signal transduction histidine kinase